MRVGKNGPAMLCLDAGVLKGSRALCCEVPAGCCAMIHASAPMRQPERWNPELLPIIEQPYGQRQSRTPKSADPPKTGDRSRTVAIPLQGKAAAPTCCIGLMPS